MREREFPDLVDFEFDEANSQSGIRRLAVDILPGEGKDWYHISRIPGLLDWFIKWLTSFLKDRLGAHTAHGMRGGLSQLTYLNRVTTGERSRRRSSRQWQLSIMWLTRSQLNLERLAR